MAFLRWPTSLSLGFCEGRVLLRGGHSLVVGAGERKLFAEGELRLAEFWKELCDRFCDT